MTLVDDVLQRVRVHVAQRRLRLDDFFTDFDALHTGRITAEQFRRALAVNNIQLSSEEYEAIREAFAVSSKSHGTFNNAQSKGTSIDVSYVSFLQAMRAQDPPPELLTTLRRKAKTLSDEEESMLEAATSSLRHSARVRGIHLRKAFEDFDPFHSGKVNASQFRRCIPFEAMREDVLELIIKKYSNEDGDVLYAAWCKNMEGDLDSSRAAVPAAASVVTGLSHQNVNKKLSFDELLSVLRSQFALYRLRCDDFLRSYDHFRTGFVTAPQFESALGQLRFVNFYLTAEHIDTLIRAYSDSKLEGVGNGTNEEAFPRVNYVQFLADTNPNANNCALGSTNYYEMSRIAGKLFYDDEDEKERAEAVVKKVRQLILSNRINLTPILHDFDRVQKGIYEHRTCTVSRFTRSLASNKIFLKPEEIDLLVKRYRICNANGTPSDKVNYYQFIMDVDQVKKPELNTLPQIKSETLTEILKVSESSRLPPADSVPDVLAKLAMQAEERHLRVNEFFIDFDPLRSGIVQTEKFAVALGIAGLKLHPQELSLLQANYKSTKARDHIDVVRFVADIGKIAPTAVPSVTAKFNMANSHSDKSNDFVPAVEIVKKNIKTQSGRLTDAERDQLPHLLARISHDVTAHHALLTPFFSDFDRLHQGKISRTNFLRALARHRFVLTPQETGLLSRYYASPNDTELIEYTRFVRDVGHNEASLGIISDKKTAFASSVSCGAVNTASVAGGETSSTGNTAFNENLVESVLTKICCFLQERNARLSEFFPDGDELRHGHVTNFRFRHCVSILGLNLTETELRALETAFAHHELKGHVDYPSFFSVVSEKLKAGVGIMAVTQRRSGLPTVVDFAEGTGASNVTGKGVIDLNDLETGTQDPVKGLEHKQTELYKRTMGKVRRTLASRRSISLSAFRQYDRARKGFVKEGQFFATLMSLGVQLSPEESDILRKVHSIGGGEIGYTRFSHAIDDQRFA